MREISRDQASAALARSLLTINVEIKCDEPSATTCKRDKRGINVASVWPVQAGFRFPCFWQHYLNFDTSSSFLRRILGLLTLPGYQAWGFLIHRLTFKRYVLSAIVKPFNRTKYQLTSLTHSNPRGSISKSVLGYEPRVRVCPTLLNK